jgi:protein gp37
MADRTSIEWTDASWNTIGGCTRVDEGCRNCYAEVMATRFSDPGQWGEGLAHIVKAGGSADHRWTGKVIYLRATCPRSTLRALLRRAHEAMSRREPDGIPEDAWNQLVADLAKELGEKT